MFIGDVGALYGTFEIFFNFLLSTVLQASVILEQSIISGVFRQRKNQKSLDLYPCTISYTDWFISLFALCLPSGEDLKRKGRMRTQGLRRIERELDVQRFIRNQIILAAFLRTQTTSLQR
jgi:hypothetical protein